MDCKRSFVRMGSDIVGECYQIAFIAVAAIITGMRLLHMFNPPRLRSSEAFADKHKDCCCWGYC